MGTVTLAARALVALVFAISAVSKLPTPETSRTTFREFGAGERLVRLALLLAPAELAVVAGLVFVPTARWSALAACLLLLVFIGGMLNALRLGRRPDCGCFGGLRPTPIGVPTLMRNGVLVAVAGMIVALGPGPEVDGWLRSHTAGQALLVAAGVLVAATVLVLGGSKHSGAAADAATSRLSGPTGPSLGAHAPEFSTRDTTGKPQTLTSLRASGQPLVLVFGSADCGSCTPVLSQVSRWQATMSRRLQITVVGTGDAIQAQRVHEHYGLEVVLLDDGAAISRSYGVRITPTAFAVSPQGTIANGPAVGADAIEDLIRLTLHRGEPMLGPWNPTINAA